MKVLIVTHHTLDANSGGSFASRAYINAIAEIADDCRLLYPDNGSKIETYISEKVEKRGIKNRVSKIGKLIDIYRGRINRYHSVFFNEVEAFKPDWVVFDNSRSSAAYVRKLKQMGTKTITIHHNYEMQYYKGSKPPVLWRFPFLYYMKNAEKNAVLYSDINLTLTNEDIQLLKNNYIKEKEFAPRFECIGMFEYARNTSFVYAKNRESHFEKEFYFAISGSLADHQTEVSLIPFLKEYYPIILNKYPKAKLVIAGRNPSDLLQNICASHSSIELVANPVDMSSILSQADFYICPTNVGGGLKLRIMDGLKLGLPVLTHEVSARGYDVFKENGTLVAYSDLDSFEKKLDLLVLSKISKNEIVNRYDTYFSFEAGVERLRKIFNDFIIVCQNGDPH